MDKFKNLYSVKIDGDRDGRLLSFGSPGVLWADNLGHIEGDATTVESMLTYAGKLIRGYEEVGHGDD